MCCAMLARVETPVTETKEGNMGGWIRFAGVMMLVMGSLDFFQGLIAIIRDKYYLLTPSQIIVFDFTTWGWIMLIWGVVVMLAGFGLLAASGWARWLTIVIASLNFVVQLGFVGSYQYTLWALTVISLNFVVLYALIVRWGDARAEALG
jgi:cation transport ATPase